jgi:hypothetical protein
MATMGKTKFMNNYFTRSEKNSPPGEVRDAKAPGKGCGRYRCWGAIARVACVAVMFRLKLEKI